MYEYTSGFGINSEIFYAILTVILIQRAAASFPKFFII